MGLINDIPTCDELVSRIVAEAEELITGRLADMVDAVGRRECRVSDRSQRFAEATTTGSTQGPVTGELC